MHADSAGRQAFHPSALTPPRSFRVDARTVGALRSADITALQRRIGNLAVQRLVAALQTAANVRPRLPLQRRVGDSLIVNTDRVQLRKTRSRTADVHPDALRINTLGMELDGRSDNWVKLQVIGMPADDTRPLLGVRGWLTPNQVNVEPGTIKPGTPIEEAPEQFSRLDGELFGDGPSSDDIQQGGLGDCWLLSPLGAIADTTDGARLIREMITPMPGGKYRVRFYRHIGGGKFDAQFVQVTDVFPTDSEGKPLYAENVGALWPLVIEKAYAESRGGYFNIAGGTQYRAYAVVTGHFPTGHALVDSDREGVTRTESGAALLGLLTTAKTKGQPVTAGVPIHTMKEQLQFKRFPYEGTVTYVAQPTRKPSDRVGLSIEYPHGDKTVKQNAFNMPDLKIVHASGDITMLEFTPQSGENRDTIPVQVTYFTSDLGEDRLVGNHAYMVHDVKPDDGTFHLIDPHDNTKVFTVTVEEVTRYGITFYVGDVTH